MPKKERNKNAYGTISLTMPVIERIKGKIEGTGMHSVSAYVAFILRQILSSGDNGEILSKEKEAELKRRLKSLGYG